MRSDVDSSAPSDSSGLNGVKEDARTILSEITSLKSILTTCKANSGTETRSSLQEAYVRLLLVDLEVALDEKVEQDLWNIVYKQPITDLQLQIRDRSNSNRAQAQINHRQLLDQASECYRRLLQELHSAYALEIPAPHTNSCLHQGSNATFLDSLLASVSGEAVSKPAKTCSSCTYMYQHCLVHLGDVARYNLHNDEAREFYMWSATIAPSCGHPYNQLAILEASKNHHLASVFYYARSLACTTPFPAASSNLDKLFDRLSREPLASLPATVSSNQLSNATDVLTTAFLQFHAAVHLNKDMSRARKVCDRLLIWLSSNLNAFNAEEMAFIGGIQLYALYLNVHKKQASLRHNAISQSSSPEIAWTRLLLQSTVGLIGALSEGINKSSSSSQSHTLPTLLLLILWYRLAVREGYYIFSNTKDSTPSNGATNSLTFASNFVQLLNHLDKQLFTNSPVSSLTATVTTSDAVTNTDNPSRRRCHSDTVMSPLNNGLAASASFEDPEDSLDIAVISELPEIQLLQGYLPLSIPPLAKPLSTHFSSMVTPDVNTDVVTSSCCSFYPGVTGLRVRVLLEAARYISHHQPCLLKQLGTSVEGGVGGHLQFSLGGGNGRHASGGDHHTSSSGLVVKRPSRPATASDPLQMVFTKSTEERLPGQYPLPSSPSTTQQSSSEVTSASISVKSRCQRQNRSQRQNSAGSTAPCIPPSSLIVSDKKSTDHTVRKSISLDEGTNYQHEGHNHPGLIVNASIARFIHAQAANTFASSCGAGGSKPNSASSTPATTPTSNTAGHMPTVAKRVHSLSTSSTGPPPVNGNLTSPTSSSRHLYNQNREQFQKDLPPRFAGRRTDAIVTRPQQGQLNGHPHYQPSSSGVSSSSIINGQDSPTSSIMQVGMWDPSSPSADMGPCLPLARKESEPLFPNDPPPAVWYSGGSQPHNRTTSGSKHHHHSHPQQQAHQFHHPPPHASFLSGPTDSSMMHSNSPLVQQDPNTLDRMQRYLPINNPNGMLDNMLASWPPGNNSELHKSHFTTAMEAPFNQRHSDMPVIDHWAPPDGSSSTHQDPLNKLYSGNVQSLWTTGPASGVARQQQHQQPQQHISSDGANSYPAHLMHQQQQRFMCGGPSQTMNSSHRTGRTDAT